MLPSADVWKFFSSEQIIIQGSPTHLWNVKSMFENGCNAGSSNTGSLGPLGPQGSSSGESPRDSRRKVGTILFTPLTIIREQAPENQTQKPSVSPTKERFTFGCAEMEMFRLNCDVTANALCKIRGPRMQVFA